MKQFFYFPNISNNTFSVSESYDTVIPMSIPKQGNLILNGTIPEKHELEMVIIFLAMGKNIEFLKPSRIKGAKTPDIVMDGISWEMKSPTGNKSYTIEEQLRRASKQSAYIIIDTRRTLLLDIKIEKQIYNYLKKSHTIKKVLVVNKKSEVLDIKIK
jgi:hypothetical protein